MAVLVAHRGGGATRHQSAHPPLPGVSEAWRAGDVLLQIDGLFFLPNGLRGRFDGTNGSGWSMRAVNGHTVTLRIPEHVSLGIIETTLSTPGHAQRGPVAHPYAHRL